MRTLGDGSADHGVRPTRARFAPRVLSAFFGMFIATGGHVERGELVIGAGLINPAGTALICGQSPTAAWRSDGGSRPG